jgi:hypothetical protein
VLNVDCDPLDTSARYYDSYTLNNPSGSQVCVTVQVQAPTCYGFYAIQSAAYLGSYNPNAVCANFLGDIGQTPYEFAKSYSFNVPAGATFVVVVNTIEEGFVCRGYTVRVIGLPLPGCATPVPTATSTALPTNTPRPATGTPPATATSVPATALPTQTVPVPSATLPLPTVTLPAPTVPLPTATETPVAGECSIAFSDVPEGSAFHMYVQCLVCREIVSGYPDGTFRPGVAMTRGQLAKIVSNAAGFSQVPWAQSFEDVPPSHTFYLYIERMVANDVLFGYACGGVGEPCGHVPRPYFRPDAYATRGQVSKIVANAAQIIGEAPATQMFEDVPEGSTFYMYIQALASRSVMGGYACGGSGEPCGSTNMPYFRPGNIVTRGQMSKIVTNTFFPGCRMP